MKIEEFLEKLRETPRNWRVVPRGNEMGRIRNADGYCPIESIAGLVGGYKQGKRIGLSREVVHRIIGGADCSKPSLWRKRLLEACGLE